MFSQFTATTNRFFVLFAIVAALFIGLPSAIQAQSENEPALANEYYNDGEYERALELYNKLYKDNSAVDFYLVRAVDCLLYLEKGEEALETVNKAIKKNPLKYTYVALKGKVLDKMGIKGEAESTWNKLITTQLREFNDFSGIGGFFMSNQYYSWAKKNYLQARLTLKDDNAFANELGYLFEFDGEYEAAATEFLKMYYSNAAFLPSTRAQILRLQGKGAQTDAVERALLKAQANRPSDLELLELLYDFYLQAQNYPEALTQARALDKQKKESCSRIIKLAEILQQNKAFDYSNEALDYVIKSCKEDSYRYQTAFLEKAKNFELKAFEQRPVDTTTLRNAVQNYDQLFVQFDRTPALFEAMYRKARLCVFYLNDLPAALAELENIEAMPIAANKKAEARLLMGDIFVMQGHFFRAKIKYGEVEEQFKEGQMGAQAKFRAAQLSYFKGDFEQAKAYLKILKENTSNDIANDALRLYLTIQDNIGLDTSTTALELFANAQLYVYRKLYDSALVVLDTLAFRFPGHELADEILWERVNIALNQNQTDKCIELINRLIANFPESIYADDALFTKAELTEFVLKNPKLAQDLYLELLTRYPSSLYKVEARKRIRKIRGDNTGS